MPHKPYAEMLAEARGAPIRVRDHTIHGIHRIAVPTDSALVVRFIRATEHARQALRLTVSGGSLTVNGQTLRDVVLWSDTVPAIVNIRVTSSGSGCVVKVWNAWQDETGAMQAWIGDCGMLIEHTPAGVRLRCSDGVGTPDFDDLVVDLGLAPSEP